MKTIKLFVYALIVCMSFVGVAEAKGRTGSFKSGFSSQKRAAPKPAPASYQTPPANTQANTQANKTAFGSFGGANPKLDQKAAAIPQSHMSKDLNATAAQSNALKTADARTKANEKVNATNSDSGWFRSGNQNTAAQKPAAVTGGGQAPQHYQPAPQYNSGHQSNGLLYGLAGFMLGHSLAQQHTNTVYVPQNNQTIGQDANQINSAAADGIALQQAQEVAVVETESFFMKLLRFVLWVAMIGGVVWVVRKLMGFRNRSSQQAANYSLRS